jgi:hypothetical protein
MATVVLRWSAPVTVEVPKEIRVRPSYPVQLKDLPAYAPGEKKSQLNSYRVVRLQRPPQSDGLLSADVGSASTSVVIPGSDNSAGTAQLLRLPATFRFDFTETSRAQCVSPIQGMQFDLKTVEISAGSPGWTVAQRSPTRICIEYAGRAPNPLDHRKPFNSIELRVVQIGLQPASKTNFFLCVGEYPDRCPPNAIVLSCGSSVEDYVRKTCSYFTVNRISDLPGNRCGYLVTRVECLTSR